ncbi:MAG TPA: hypothetical protein VHY10_03730 [Xanthobacteraceae bacterium]|jgi:hypothetical protein|nr:hypothetical protein [Xanthobacteraceae bacterium]
MRKAFLTAFATAALSSAALVGGHAAATNTTAAPASAALSQSFVREAAIVCGGNGCNPVQTKANKKRKFQTLGHG